MYQDAPKKELSTEQFFELEEPPKRSPSDFSSGPRIDDRIITKQ